MTYAYLDFVCASIVGRGGRVFFQPVRGYRHPVNIRATGCGRAFILFDGSIDSSACDVFVCVMPIWTRAVSVNFVFFPNVFVDISC